MHGEQNEMGRLKAALIREYEDNPVSSVPKALHSSAPLKYHFSFTCCLTVPYINWRLKLVDVFIENRMVYKRAFLIVDCRISYLAT